MTLPERLGDITAEVCVCRRCPRLVEWRERVARERVARFAGEVYWGRPVPGFGDPAARILLVGLAPAAHGGNRTGRVFTGDRSGDFLFDALYRAGLSTAPASRAADDGLRLAGVYIAAVNRCAPPANAPTPAERDACLPFLLREMQALTELRVVVALGAYAWKGCLRAAHGMGIAVDRSTRFGHGAQTELGRYGLMGSFHPSQQNTFTGKLTPQMLDDVLTRAKVLAGLADLV